MITNNYNLHWFVYFVNLTRVFSVCVSAKTVKGRQTISLNNTNRQEFAMEMQFVFCQIDNEF